MFNVWDLVLVIYNVFMLLIVGLGNPGKKYEGTRHNVGFMVIDKLAEELGVDFENSDKFQAKIAQTTLTFQGRTGRTRLVLAKPQTYMNLSGDAVSKLISFYKLRPEDQLWVVHDDLDIEIGTIRIRLNGSSAGQKGIESIINRLGTNEFVRFRVGIKPVGGQKESAEEFVLKKFTKEERKTIEDKVAETVNSIVLAVEKGIVPTTK